MSARGLIIIRVTVFLLCLVPAVFYASEFFTHRLGANPIEVITRRYGEWGLILLLITLCMTPLRVALQQAWPLRIRRMLGLYAFVYVLMHLLLYLWLDQEWDWSEIGRDILKRPFITVGMLAFLLLVPLAVTSTQAMQRRLKRNWVRLHRLIYLIVILGCLHFYWLVKADITRPVGLATAAAVLLFFRGVQTIHRRKKAAIPAA